MRNTLATVWSPLEGLSIEEVKTVEGKSLIRYLFIFYNEVDVKRVLEKGPWTFDNNQLVIKRLQEGKNPKTVPLTTVDFWIQVHKLPSGFMSEKVARHIGNYLGEFLESDEKNFQGSWN